MKRFTVTWALAAIICSLTWAPLPQATAEDPPPLEPPALTTPAPERAGAADPLAVIRREGPPRDLPEDRAGPAPGPDYFYIAGQYVPSGTGVAWRPGFWARTQPGWEWVPARWVHRSEGWVYREGHWARDESEVAAPEAPRRHVVARPAPAPTGAFSPDPTAAADRQFDPGTVTELAPLPDAGATGRAPGVQPSPGLSPTPPPPPPGLPNENGNAAANPNPELRVISPFPPLVLPVTEINVPGVHIRIVPPVPVVGNPYVPYPGVVVPPVQVRVVRPLFGVRQRVRDLIDSVLP
jgi:hypothetical protein